MKTYVCPHPACGKVFEVHPFFGIPKPILNEHHEIVGWNPETYQDHMTPVDPEFVMHFIAEHPRDGTERMAKLLADTMAEHEATFPQSE